MTDEPVSERSAFITRRAVLSGAAAGLALIRTPDLAFAAGFQDFIQSLWPAMEAQGVGRQTFDAVVTPLTPDPKLPKTSAGQAEFEKPLQSYYREAVTSARISTGRVLATRYATALAQAESRFGVPGQICLAAWAIESDFGRTLGTKDVVRTLATLAWTRPERPEFKDEIVAALVILQRGEVPRDKLVGSWAGAMGAPQFLPSAYLKYAVAAAGGTSPDIWTNPDDIILSVASFLRGEGWTADEPWLVEVLLPSRFDFPTLHGSADEWARLGVQRPDGKPLAGKGDAALFCPAGAGGPAFLLFPNYFVIKRYNNSDSYALSFGSLAQRIAGAEAPATAWPSRPIVLSRTDKIFVQRTLTALGLYKGAQDGKFGPLARDAIHQYQRSAGLTPADGFATPQLVAAMKAR